MTCNERIKNHEITNKDVPTDFEEAISAAGFGKFNFCLYIIASATGLTTVFEFYAIPFILPAVQCDLNLSLFEKAVINCISIAGMAVSGLFSGYISDVIGRRKFIIYASLLDTVCGISSALSHGFLMLAISKFLGGFIVSGIYSALTSYLSEIHSEKFRSDVQLFVGLLYGIGQLLLPLLAIGILKDDKGFYISPYLELQNWNIYLTICIIPSLISGLGFIFLPESPKFLMSYGDNSEALVVFQQIYHLNTNCPREKYPLQNWNIYLTICIIPSLISGLGFIFLPESPKFLMSYGDNSEALVVFQQIYHLNTNCPREKYPITQLIESAEIDSTAIGLPNINSNIFSHYWQEITTVFGKKYIYDIVLVVFIQFLILLGLDTYGLLIPLILHDLIIEDNIYNGNKSISVCDTLDKLADSGKQTCTVTSDEYQVYIYCIIISSATILIFLISIFIVNIIGKCRLLFLLGVINSFCIVGLSFSKNIMFTVALSSIIIPFGNISFNVLIGIVTDIFPSKIRATAVALTMSTGRVGAIFGSFVIPVSIQFGCATPSIFTGFAILVYSILTFLLPNTIPSLKK